MMQAGGFTFADSRPVTEGWTMAVLPAGRCETPADAVQAGLWLDAPVPGTAAQALKQGRRSYENNRQRLHDCDVWYIRHLDAHRGMRLRFEGLATLADVFINGDIAATSESMFQPLELTLEHNGLIELALSFRSLNRRLGTVKGKRARWKTSLAENQDLRFIRTSFLGHMSGWCPPVDIVGPYRPVTTLACNTISRRDIELAATCDNGTGMLTANFTLPAGYNATNAFSLICAGQSAPFRQDGNVLRATLSLPEIEPWFPHTHGKPRLHHVAISCGDQTFSLGKTGFRHISIDRGADGSRFGFVINGVKAFARGACWTPPDIVSLPCDKETLLRQLATMRDAGMNMVRVPGITLYESPAFFEAADELGIMVWQELQFANFDYPFADESFRAIAEMEARNFLKATRANCSLVAICGGSEIAQQAAMMGMPKSVWENCTNAAGFREIATQERADIVFIENSPVDGDLPFHVNNGIAHYYGVGAYLRPLEDARCANVSFAAECLAFSNVPDAASLHAHMNVPAVHHPIWKQRVPRDRGASWDFEDVREHYMHALYGIDCASLRREDPERYLAFARAAPAEVMEATYDEWRHPRSRTDGALVFLWKDLWFGAGWGIVDSTGRPKSVWYALERAFRPIQLIMTDEGVNGLHLHILNETSETRKLKLAIDCLAQGCNSVARGERIMDVNPRGTTTINTVEFFGAFFDANYAYRFGPPAHNIVVGQLRDADTGKLASEAFHFPLGRARVMGDPEIEASLIEEDGDFALALQCRRFAQTISIDEQEFLPMRNYFHLAPGERRVVPLRRLKTSATRPQGSVRALNSHRAINY
jgi:beta-mannosidase